VKAEMILWLQRQKVACVVRKMKAHIYKVIELKMPKKKRIKEKRKKKKKEKKRLAGLTTF
jgi:hypothetical protein